MKTTSTPSLGTSQHELELATAALKAAQDAYAKAQATLQRAEQRHLVAWQAMDKEAATVRERCKVAPAGYR